MRYPIKVVDPVEVQSRFAAPEPLSFEEYEEDNLNLDDLEPFLKELPPREVDLIEMYYRLRKKQKEIAEFFSVSQGAISHRLSRARKRLKFLRDLPKVEGSIFENLKNCFSYRDIEIIDLMIKTTCQSETADIINKKYNLEGKDKLSQVKVRHRFLRSISKLEKESKNDKILEGYFNLCSYINNSLYLRHPVHLPHFDRGFSVVYKPRVIQKKMSSVKDVVVSKTVTNITVSTSPIVGFTVPVSTFDKLIDLFV